MTDYINTLLPLISIIALFGILFVFILNSNVQKRIQRDEDKKIKAELSLMREELERQLYKYNDRINSDTSRWLDINHLLLKNVNQEIPTISQGISNSFFRSMGVDIANISIEKDLVFCLTPFHKDFSETYFNIKEACNSMGLRCIKGDEDYIESNVLKYIIEKMMAARVVIANINGRNPNVFYELGIAHAIGKPTILISRMENLDKIPFDLQSNQLVLYHDRNELSKTLIKSLSQILISSKA